MSAVPGVNTLVRVALGEESTMLPSRIEELDGDDIVIAAPAYVGDIEEPQEHDIVSLYWTQARGVCSLPAHFIGVERRPVKLWRLRTAGTVELVQRRRFTRVPVQGAVSLVGEDVDLVRVGWMVDLGEGGVRCRLAPGSFADDQPVECRLSLDGQVVIVPGTVLRAEPGAQGADDVVVTFDENHRACEAVRKFVFAQQLLARRMAAAAQ